MATAKVFGYSSGPVVQIPRVGSEVSGYRLEAVIGRGGMSIVYLARHLRLGKKVAFKILSPELSEDDNFRARFVQEASKAASLDHPNIIPVLDAGEADGVLFIAMQYVKGPDLKTVLDQEGRLHPQRAVSIVSQVAGALDAAHAEGLIHRDVKPGNILLIATTGPDVDDHVYLTDFGLTKLARDDTTLTEAGQVVGTPDFMAPEQIQGAPLDHRVDVYSLGGVAFQCLTGSVPYPRDVEMAVLWAHVNDPPPSVTERVPSLPALVDAPVARAMAKNPADRYDSCRQFASDLRRSLGVGSGERAEMTGATVVGSSAPAGATVVGAGVPPGATVVGAATPPPGATVVGPTAGVPRGAGPGGPPGPKSSPFRSPVVLAAAGGGIAAAIVLVLVLVLKGGPSVPTIPTLRATAVAADSVRLTWSGSTATGYTLYRNGQRLQALGGGTTSFNDRNLSPSTRYTYAIDALGSGGKRSARSPAVAVTTPEEPFPTAAESDLLTKVPSEIRDSCKRPDQAAAGSTAGVVCTSGSLQVAFAQFPDNKAMFAYYSQKLTENGVTSSKGNCPSDLPSEEYWFFQAHPNVHVGRLACFVQGGRAWLIWTDNRSSLSRIVSGDGSDMNPEFDYWKQAA